MQINVNNSIGENSKCLWCTRYDSQSVYKDFLKIEFSKFLKDIVSNKYFPQYQKQIARELQNPLEWSDRCWHLLKFFEFLNNSFEITELDKIVAFIQEETLRRVMGHFRLWIDLERLYLFNFLKLDKVEFQDQRIYMTLYRTLIFLTTLFTEYDIDDFDKHFIEQFCHKCILLLDALIYQLSKQTKPLAQSIKTLLKNFKNKSPHLIDSQVLESYKRSVKIKLAIQNEKNADVQERLFHKVKYSQKLQQEKKVRLVLQMAFIEGFTKEIQTVHDPIKKIKQQHKQQVKRYAQSGQKQSEQLQLLQTKLNTKVAQIVGDGAKRKFIQIILDSIYENIKKTNHNPYDNFNFIIYGELLNLDLEKKNELSKKQQKKVVSKNQDDELKIYYEPGYIQSIEDFKPDFSKVALQDMQKKKKSGGINSFQKSSQDEQNKIFNLRYSFIEQEKPRSKIQTEEVERDFDNNILFRNEIDEYLQNTKINMIKRFAMNQCQSKTFLDIKYRLSQMFPEEFKTSFGADLFKDRQPLCFSLKNLNTVNRNKFDQMRKIITYMTAQKKIRRVIVDVDIPQKIPRNYSDIKYLYYNPMHVQQKIRFCDGTRQENPNIII